MELINNFKSMFKKVIFLVLVSFFSIVPFVLAQNNLNPTQTGSQILVLADAQMEAQIQQGLQEAQNKKAQIENQCRQDPYTCSCSGINCQDILAADHPRAQEAYQRCVLEKNNCESQRQAAIQEIENSKAKIEAECRENLSSCDCNSIKNPEGKKQCELAIIGARYQAEEEKQNKIKICTEDIDACDCSQVSDPEGQKECEEKLFAAQALRDKIKQACEEDALNCDCSEIESQNGRQQCEEAKRKGMEEAENAVKSSLSKCFKDVETCNCSDLDLPKESYVSFCEIQKTYGLSCKHEGTNCDKLDNIEIYPPGMPVWLGKIFAKDYSSYIEKEKAKGAKEAAGIIRQCLNDPENCQCEKTPNYARAFCEKNKALQIKCEGGDYDACIILDESSNLPKGVPEFSYNILDKLVGGLRSARKNSVISNAARKVGNMIMACMDNANNCDCSLAPVGTIKSFCLNKQELVQSCRANKNYEACFRLDEEDLYPIQTPNLIQKYIEKNVAPKIEEKKEKIFNQMKVDTICENISTLDECKEFYRAEK